MTSRVTILSVRSSLRRPGGRARRRGRPGTGQRPPSPPRQYDAARRMV